MAGIGLGNGPRLAQSNGAGLFLSPPRGLTILLASPTPYGVGCILSTSRLVFRALAFRISAILSPNRFLCRFSAEKLSGEAADAVCDREADYNHVYCEAED